MMVRRSEINSYLAIFIFVMLCFGFVISSFVPIYFTVPSRPFNLAFRALYLGISIYLILVGYRKLTERGMTKTFWTFSIFLILYTIRILYDSLILGIIFKNSLFFLFTFSIGGTFIPFLAIAMFSKEIDYDRLLKFSYLVLFTSAILMILLIVKLYGSIGIEFLAARFSFLSDDGKSETINPITLSHYGMMLSLLSIYLLLFRAMFPKLVVGVSLGLGLFLMLAGASRGPQITFAIGFLFLLYIFIFRLKKTNALKLKFISICIFISILFSMLIAKIDLESISMYNRFANFGKDASSDTSMREKSWERAWNYFLENPLIGNSYMDIYNNSYPHNVYLETLMAMGLVGGLLFLMPFISLAFKTIRNVNQIYVFTFFIAAALSSFFSGSLFINPLLWSIIGIMMGFNFVEGKKLRG